MGNHRANNGMRRGGKVNGGVRARRRATLLAGAAVMFVAGPACQLSVLTLEVNSALDRSDVSPGNGVCEAATGLGDCTLRAAVDEANATVGAVQINIAAGNYLLTKAGVDDTNVNGDLDITGQVTLLSQGAVAIDGGELDRTIDVSGQLTMAVLTVQGGTATGDGGGLRVRGTGSATLIGVNVRNNTATSNGGGIAVTGGSLTFLDSTVSGNIAGRAGGGIAVSAGASSSVTNSTISGNTADPGALAGGGSGAGGAPQAASSGAAPTSEAPAPSVSAPDQTLVAGGSRSSSAAVDDHTVKPPVDAENRIAVIVEVRMPNTPAASLDGLDGTATVPGTQGVDTNDLTTQAAVVATATDPVLDHVGARSDVVVNRTYSLLPMVALSATDEVIDDLRRNPAVVSVQPDLLAAPTLAQSLPRINADDVHAAGNNGTGTAIAVLDTGVDPDEPMTAGKVVAEACFARGVDGLLDGTGDCPNGADSQTGFGSGVHCPWFTGGSSCWHGTHVASTAAGSARLIGGVSHEGVGSGSGIVAVNVFSHFFGATTCGTGRTECVLSYTSDQLAGLNWVLAQAASVDISAVNMSLGGGTNSAHCDLDSRKSAIDLLRTAGVITVIASGNNGSKTGVAAPGCISTALTVGATDDIVDSVAGFSQSAAILDVLAPGVNISAEYPTVPGDPADYTTTASGTSMATPHVAGAVGVLAAADPSATVDQVEAALIATGVLVADTNGISKPRIDLAAARRRIADVTGNGVGGGIHNSGTTSIRLSTIAGNVAWSGGGIHASATGSVTINGSVVATHGFGADCQTQAGATIVSAGYNVASDATCFTGGTDLSSTNPLLGALAANGGPTETRLPGGGSVLRNRIPVGTLALCDGAVTTDQRLSTRPVGGACDAGAVES